MLNGFPKGSRLGANDVIAKNPREAAEIFVKIENTRLPVAFTEKMISDPEFSYTRARERDEDPRPRRSRSLLSSRPSGRRPREPGSSARERWIPDRLALLAVHAA
jgi:hypothetical protein